MADVVLVTGGRGFVGRWIVRDLLQAGHSVVILVRRRDWAVQAPSGCTIEEGDLQDFERLGEILRRNAVARVVHVAAVVGPAADAAPLEAVRTNVGGTANLLEAARRGDVERLVYVSSGSAYGVRAYSPRPLAEDAPTGRPLPNMYACTKFQGEELCETYGVTFGLSAVSVRLSRIFGPGRPTVETRLPIDDLIMDALAGRPIRMGSDPGAPTDYTYVKDVAAGVRAVLEAARPTHRLYNLSGGNPSTTDQIRGVLGSLFPGLEVSPGPVVGERTQCPYPRPPLDNSRIRSDLAFVSRFDLRAAIIDYIAEIGAGDSDPVRRG